MLDYKLDFKKQTFAVVGLGDTGLSIIKFLKYQNANILKILDTRENYMVSGEVRNLLSPQTTVCLGKLDYTSLAAVDVIVVSPGVSIYENALQLALHNNKIVIGDVELFAYMIKDWASKVIGITGSNGKTTVTTLTGYILQNLGFKTLVAGNIGTPVLTSYLDIIQNDNIPEYIVLELSSFQLESIYSLKLDAATVLNISEDHLDRYRDLLEYAYAKANIFNNCKTQILADNDVLVHAMSRQNLLKLKFGTDEKSEFALLYASDNNPYLQVLGKKFIECKDLALIGAHNYLNILAVLALIAGAGVDVFDPKIIMLLKEFKGLEHRMQKVLEHKGIIYVEDSKGTNVGAVIAGVSGLDMPVHLILGGDGKGQDFFPLRDLVSKKCKSVAVIGQDKDLILEVLNGLAIPIKSFNTLEAATEFCHNNAKPNEYVVLSPACASWDMFDNYKQRAQVFVDCVKCITYLV